MLVYGYSNFASSLEKQMPKEKTLYTLVLDEEVDKVMDELQSHFGLDSRAATFDLAVSLLCWSKKETEVGNNVGRLLANSLSFQEVHFLTPKGMVN